MQASDVTLLARAALDGDQGRARACVKVIAANEERAGHTASARELRTLLARTPDAVEKTRSQACGLVEETMPEQGLDSVALPDGTRKRIETLLDEQRRAGDLHEHGVAPRHTLLLYGPPGNGKTTLASAIACELGLPLLTVSYPRLIESQMGRTSTNVSNVMAYAGSIPCVLFMDEVETLLHERGDKSDVAEMSRVTATLLMEMDRLPETTFVVAATNHAEMLDRAVWRRFEARELLPRPTEPAMRAWAEAFEREHSCRLGMDGARLLEALDGAGDLASFSMARDACLTALRECILGGTLGPDGEVPADAIAEQARVIVGEARGRNEGA